MKCPKRDGKSHIGISRIIPKHFQARKKIETILQEFYLGNGVKTTDKIRAANDQMQRDHEKLLKFLRGYRHGVQLGAYFVPSIFISQVSTMQKLRAMESIRTC